MQRAVKIALVAGEISGDLLASHLIRALSLKLPGAVFYGIGGPKMREQGFVSWFPMEKLAVMGLVEAARHFAEIYLIRRALKRRLLADPPDIFIGVDAPDFNLALEKTLKRAGIRTVHYVSPSVWAWRRGRIKTIAESVSCLLTLFPFEAAVYEKENLAVRFVGHPLADLIPVETDAPGARKFFGLLPDRPIVALLPGSRRSELRFMADLFILTAKKVLETMPDALFLVPLATRETRESFEAAIYRQSAGELPLRLLFGHAREAMAAADLVLATSGTVTLEAALLKKPMVIAYRMARLTYRLMKRLYYLPYIGLPNILAGRVVVPEFIQDDATPEKLAAALTALHEDKAGCERVKALFVQMHRELKQDNADKAAAAVMECLPEIR